jgi:hypothetical protein
MLSKFRVQNYKCLGDVVVPLTPIHVLIGQNDAGKTSVLEAMYAACRSRDAAFTDAFPFAWQGRSLLRHAAPQPRLFFELAFTDSSDAVYKLEFEIGTKGDCRRVAERIKRQGESIDLSSIQTDRPDFTAVNFVRRNPQHAKEHAAAVKLIGELIPSVELHAFNPEVMSLPTEIQQRTTASLDRDGFGLAALLDEIQDYDVGLFLRIREEFCRLYGHFKSIRLKKEKGYSRDETKRGAQIQRKGVGKAIYFETHDGAEVPAPLASAGAVLLLGFLALAHMPNPPGLLLIEEPETGIYPERLKEVVALMQRFVDEHSQPTPLQLVITTHSPYLLDMFRPEQVTFLRRNEDGAVTAYPLRDVPNIQERLGGVYHLGELWYNLSEEDLFADAK